MEGRHPCSGRGTGVDPCLEPIDPQSPQDRRSGQRFAGGFRRPTRPLPLRFGQEMTSVFADTFFFLAAVNNQDVFHARAIDFSARFEGRIITTEWVLVETANALAHARSRQAFSALDE